MTDTTPPPADPAFFQQMRAMIDQCGPKAGKHEVTTILMYACIDRGINTARGLINALHDLGFDRRYVATVLNRGTGSDPLAYRWHVDAHGIYASHPAAT